MSHIAHLLLVVNSSSNYYLFMLKHSKIDCLGWLGNIFELKVFMNDFIKLEFNLTFEGCRKRSQESSEVSLYLSCTFLKSLNIHMKVSSFLKFPSPLSLMFQDNEMELIVTHVALENLIEIK